MASASRDVADPGDARGDGRGLLVGVAGLLALDLIGGGLAVVVGVNTPAEAWTGDAVLAAPLPMMATQAVLAVAAVRWRDRRAAVAAGLLAVACGVSAVSGFFDGQLGKEGLSRQLVGFQLLLVTATLGVAALAVARVRRVVATR